MNDNNEPNVLQTSSDIPPKPHCSTVKGYGGTNGPFLMNRNDRTLVRDNFTTSTWLLIGATLQTSLLLLPIRPSYALAPAVFLLIYRLINTLLMCVGLQHNPYMDGVTIGKRTAIYPSATPLDKTKNPTNQDICIMLLPARSSHPLGLLSPAFALLAAYFKRLIFDLDAHAPHNGFLGASSYANVGDRASASEILTVLYFRSYEHLRAFAHGDAHRAAWEWWVGAVRDGSGACLSIGHEVYCCAGGGWENVFVNYHASGFGATSHWVESEENQDSPEGAERGGKWMSPLVDAGKGQLRSSMGRMGTSLRGDDNEKYGKEPYAVV